MASSQGQNLMPPPTQIDNTNKVYSVAIACIILGIVASLSVLLRLGQRAYYRTFGYDDFAIIPALLFYMGWTAMAGTVNLTAGVGKPLWEITLGEYSVWFKGIIGSAWLYPAMTASIRVSILLFYHRIFVVPNVHGMKLAIWVLLALQVIYLIVFSILPAFICQPLNMAWNPLERQLYFHDWYYYYTQVALYSASMTFDAILLVMPLYSIYKLQMPVRKRAGVALILMLGAGASIVAAYKLAIFVIQMQLYTDIDPRWLNYEMSTLIPPQFNHYGTTFWIPSQVEPTVALIGTSLPAIYYLLFSTKKQVSVSPSSSRSMQSSGVADKSKHLSSQKSRIVIFRSVTDSGIALRSEYHELNDRAESFAK